jgi:hypothetical protein
MSNHPPAEAHTRLILIIAAAIALIVLGVMGKNYLFG